MLKLVVNSTLSLLYVIVSENIILLYCQFMFTLFELSMLEVEDVLGLNCLLLEFPLLRRDVSGREPLPVRGNNQLRA